MTSKGLLNHLPEEKIIVELYTTESSKVEQVCAKFGCGKELSLIESLAGKFCTDCSNTKPIDIMKRIKFK